MRIDPFLTHHFEAEMEGNELHLQIENDEGEVTDEIVPHKIELCPNCGGEGRHLRESLRSIAFSSDDEDYDPDFMEEMREGNYDQRCDVCGGEGRIYVIDEQYCDQKILDAIQSTSEVLHEMHMEEQAERRFCGGY